MARKRFGRKKPKTKKIRGPKWEEKVSRWAAMDRERAIRENNKLKKAGAQ